MIPPFPGRDRGAVEVVDQLDGDFLRHDRPSPSGCDPLATLPDPMQGSEYARVLTKSVRISASLRHPAIVLGRVMGVIVLTHRHRVSGNRRVWSYDELGGEPECSTAATVGEAGATQADKLLRNPAWGGEQSVASA